MTIVLVAPRWVRMSLKSTPVEVPAGFMVVEDDLRHGRLAVSAAGVRLRVDHHHRRRGVDVHRLDRDQRDGDQLDHRPILRPRDHPVGREDDRLAGLGRLDQGLDPQHAGERVGVRIDVRDRDDPGERRQHLQEPVGSVPPGQISLGVEVCALRLGRHRRLDPRRDGAAGLRCRQEVSLFRRVHSSLRHPAHGSPVRVSPDGLPGEPASVPTVTGLQAARHRVGAAGPLDRRELDDPLGPGRRAGTRRRSAARRRRP